MSGNHTQDNEGTARGVKPIARAFAFPRSRRLTGDGTFGEVMAARAKFSTPLFAAHAVPNSQKYSRLGISVSRKVGKANVRNAIKRFVREAFRLSSPAWSAPYDVVLVIKRHEPVALSEYHKSLEEAIDALHTLWLKRNARTLRKGQEEP
ncbi:MAG: ribonuclease P protein component [Phycisphaerales bacterium]|nr:ribonuclease P protein component [Phycisphaerales bacterium]